MELEDSALPFLQGLVATTSAKVAFADVDYALLVGGFPRKPVRLSTTEYMCFMSCNHCYRMWVEKGRRIPC
jgi:hypothetical protein